MLYCRSEDGLSTVDVPNARALVGPVSTHTACDGGTGYDEESLLSKCRVWVLVWYEYSNTNTKTSW